MATHNVTMELPARPMTKADAIFRVKENGEMLGTLTVSRGSLVWFGKGKSKGRKIGWQKFADLMEEHAPRIERR